MKTIVHINDIANADKIKTAIIKKTLKYNAEYNFSSGKIHHIKLSYDNKHEKRMSKSLQKLVKNNNMTIIHEDHMVGKYKHYHKISANKHKGGGGGGGSGSGGGSTKTDYYNTIDYILSKYKFAFVNKSSLGIAIISLGGTYYPPDIQTYWGTVLGRTTPMPTIYNSPSTFVPAKDASGLTNDADIENTLDISFSMGISGSNIYYYSGTNSTQGFYEAINDAVTNPKVNIISISWGGPESGFGTSFINMFNSLFETAYNEGKTICVAAGDSGSSDGSTGLNVDFPSSAQYAVSCGGTTFNSNFSIPDAVWNDANGNATGGGVSAYLAKAPWQTPVIYPQLPIGVNNANRGVPDIAMNADPDTGYTLVYGGKVQINYIGGTSCVAPLLCWMFSTIRRIQ